jgi:predicted site-specific integrase-resolvase
MNLREWAQAQGNHPQTAYRRFRQGELPVPARKMGKLILVGDLEAPLTATKGRTAIYARVSSANRKADLDRQVSRALAWATEHGYSVDEVVSEVGLASSGHRSGLLNLLRDKTATTILVEYRDRCCRFGAEYIEAALSAQGRTLVVVDPSEVDDDLLTDAEEMLRSLCSRFYGERSAASRATRAMEIACEETP